MKPLPSLSLLRLLLAACLAASALQAADPVAVKEMLPGCYPVKSDVKDQHAFGGYGGSDNASLSLRKNQLLAATPYLQVLPDQTALFGKDHAGIIVRLVNGGKTPLTLTAQDSCIDLIQEAQDSSGKWRPIEYIPQSWCGNSYHKVTLKPRRYWQFTAPRYSGPRKTMLRFKLVLDDKQTIYSVPFPGSIHPRQFTVIRDHEAANIMDPY